KFQKDFTEVFIPCHLKIFERNIPFITLIGLKRYLDVKNNILLESLSNNLSETLSNLKALPRIKYRSMKYNYKYKIDFEILPEAEEYLQKYTKIDDILLKRILKKKILFTLSVEELKEFYKDDQMPPFLFKIFKHLRKHESIKIVDS